MTAYLSLAGITFLVLLGSYLGVRLLIMWTVRKQILDVPNERSSHSRPMPRGGGLVIVVAVLLAWPVYTFIAGDFASLPLAASLAYLGGATAIAYTSWQDDLHPLPNWLRFGVHSSAALLAIAAMGYWHSARVPILGLVEVGRLGFPLTFLWIVGLTNAYNFMDGIDGLAGGQGAVAGLGWALLAWQLGHPAIMALALFLVAATASFLVYNWPPARIFMGDVGSAFFGYTFAVLPLLLSPSAERLAFAGVILVWPFVFDTGFTLLRRLRNRERIFEAHRSHLYQRLVVSGYSHRDVTLLYLALAFVNVLLALWWLGDAEMQGLILALLIMESLLLWSFVLYRERTLRRAYPRY